ncbi:mei-9 [Ecytonucleospora hepatopenaei]|uniref:Mei-9 n=1 Tax=Ecytonucleospora hepatopenaei TaxID=646526 RepID=A0A1W0E9F4_9MICR|nr:mei-9 [Ecytonucleospora hepatopenaei]
MCEKQLKQKNNFLAFEEEVLTEINHRATLFISSKGIYFNGIVELLLNFYSNEYAFCLVLNATQKQKSIIIEHIRKRGSNKRILELSSESVVKRKEEYLLGGVFFVSSLCLITDFINGNISTEQISSFFVLNSHEIYENSPEAFLLFMFKEKNKLGMINAFSCAPLQINYKLEDFVEILQCRYVCLLPRFKETVKKSLKNMEIKYLYIRQTEEVEVLVCLSIQILNQILKNENKELFKDQMPSYLDAFLYKKWHKSENVVNFLVLINLIYNADPTTIYLFYKRMFEDQQAKQSGDVWILLDDSKLLYTKIEEYVGEHNFIEENCFINTQVQTNFDEESNSFENLNNKEDVDYQIDLNYAKNTKLKKLDKFVRSFLSSKVVVLVPNRISLEIIKNIFYGLKYVDVVSYFAFEFYEDMFDVAVLLSPDLRSLRHLEVLKTKTKVNFEVVQFVWKDSIEEQVFCMEKTVEEEKMKSFIKEKQNMALTERCKKIIIDEEDEEKYNIFVDQRETRAKLPFVLYKAGNILRLEVLLVGDYEFMVGNKKVLVERKSISDFISSTNTDRLYLQSKNMVASCDHPILLLEFSGRKTPTFYAHEKFNVYGQVISAKKSLVLKLCSLLYTFPKLKIIWSNDEILTATYFRDVQKGKNAFLQDNKKVSHTNNDFFDLLMLIPGINKRNYQNVILSFKNLEDLVLSSEKQLCKCIGNESGKQVYLFLNQKF